MNEINEIIIEEESKLESGQDNTTLPDMRTQSLIQQQTPPENPMTKNQLDDYLIDGGKDKNLDTGLN